MLDPDPTWTVLDTLRDNFVARIEITDGRQSEQDETETGTCTVYLNDRDGWFDRHNASSPYYGKLDSKPIAIALYNPVTAEWVPQWRGTIDDVQAVLNPATQDGVSILANVRLECVDVFDYLARAEMQVGVSGNAPPAGSEGIIFYDNAEVDDRIIQLLTDAGVDSTRYIVFSGNVNVLESKYDPGDEFLAALKEAADAEFPGIANQYVDKDGKYVFHGRFARLDPDTVWTGIAGSDAARDAVWRFRRWKVGDGAAIQGDSDYAQIREFSNGAPRELIINSATSYPEDVIEADIPGQLVTDATSITQHGIHSRSDVNLIVASHKTNGDTGTQQCFKYATFWITYYAQPLDRVERCVVQSVHPTDSRATTTWAFLTGVSISDIVKVKVGYPGGTGFAGIDHYVEGRQLTIEPAQPTFDMVTLELNLSPAISDSSGIFA